MDHWSCNTIEWYFIVITELLSNIFFLENDRKCEFILYCVCLKKWNYFIKIWKYYLEVDLIFIIFLVSCLTVLKRGGAQQKMFKYLQKFIHLFKSRIRDVGYCYILGYIIHLKQRRNVFVKIIVEVSHKICALECLFSAPFFAIL